MPDRDYPIDEVLSQGFIQSQLRQEAEASVALDRDQTHVLVDPCFICLDPLDHNGVPHSVAKGDGRDRRGVVCGYHYEAGGKCNERADVNSRVWPGVGPCCPGHNQQKTREVEAYEGGGAFTAKPSVIEGRKAAEEALALAQQPTKVRPGDQVLPNGTGECVQDRVIAEMEESKRVGIERYGQTLRTFNGRKGIQDVREELRDAFVYLSQIEMEAEATREELVEVLAPEFDKMLGGLFQGGTRANVSRELADMAVGRILGHVVGKYVMGGARAE